MFNNKLNESNTSNSLNLNNNVKELLYDIYMISPFSIFNTFIYANNHNNIVNQNNYDSDDDSDDDGDDINDQEEDDYDYYAILNVPSDITERDLKLHYHYMSSLLHPDRLQPFENYSWAFAVVQNAFLCLKDQEKRNIYDRLGYTGVKIYDEHFWGDPNLLKKKELKRQLNHISWLISSMKRSSKLKFITNGTVDFPVIPDRQFIDQVYRYHLSEYTNLQFQATGVIFTSKLNQARGHLTFLVQTLTSSNTVVRLGFSKGTHSDSKFIYYCTGERPLSQTMRISAKSVMEQPFEWKSHDIEITRDINSRCRCAMKLGMIPSLNPIVTVTYGPNLFVQEDTYIESSFDVCDNSISLLMSYKDKNNDIYELSTTINENEPSFSISRAIHPLLNTKFQISLSFESEYNDWDSINIFGYTFQIPFFLPSVILTMERYGLKLSIPIPLPFTSWKSISFSTFSGWSILSLAKYVCERWYQNKIVKQWNTVGLEIWKNREHALKFQKVIKSNADKIKNQEKNVNGIIILEAYYGVDHDDDTEIMEAYGWYKNIDAVIPLQVLVNNSKLIYEEAFYKIPGLYKTTSAPQSDHRLHVTYLYQKNIYKVDIADNGHGLYLPEMGDLYDADIEWHQQQADHYKDT